ncbi:MAG TPA: MFS transporter [Xanthobacteraceae bacterium]|nr:MFS transporter [Xanthobacteraceae bacterium]
MSTLATVPSAIADPSPAAASLRGLDWVNFFLAGALAGFGPYVAVYLADQKWSQENVGFVLSASAFGGLLSQLPGGELLDNTRSKRVIVALGVLILALSALIIEFAPTFPLVLMALTLQGCTGAILGPAIAAISLALVGHVALSERLGRNMRFAAVGSLGAAALMGLVGYAFSYKAIFPLVVVLTLPLFFALASIHATDIHFGRSCGAPDHHTPGRPARARRVSLWKSPALLVLAVCLFLFQLGNASILPLAGESLVYRRDSHSTLIVSGLIVLPQIVVAAMSPWVGRQANNWGRRPLLLIGLGALAVRALLFALNPDPRALLAFQLLDGVSGAMIGVLTALIIADVTDGTGRFNLAQGAVGAASGIGASLSTALFGIIATSFGSMIVFMSIAAVALVAVLILWFWMPETRPATKSVGISK